MSKIDAVDYLNREAKEHSSGSAAQLAALEGLGEAGGSQAIDYLITFADEARRGTAAHCTALKALGRAGRTVA